jgi:hypothetical protein
MRFALIASLAVGAVFAQAADALPGNLPPGPPPTGGNAFGVTAPVGKPIADRAGFVSWQLLTQVQPVPKGNTFEPKFDRLIEALDKKTVKLQGFMLPLEMGEKQSHFVLTSTPPTCAFCLPGGPDQVIEIKAKTPIKYGYEPIQLTGRFEVLRDDPMGLYYRLNDARLLPR